MEKNERSVIKFIKSEWLLMLLIFIYYIVVYYPALVYLALLIVPLLIFKNGFWRYFDSVCVWIIVFSVYYAFVANVYSLNPRPKGAIITFSIYPIMFYIAGRYLMDKWYSLKYLLLMLITLPIAIAIFQGVYDDIIHTDLISTAREVSINGINVSVTIHGVRLSLCIACIGMIFAVAQDLKERIYIYVLFILGVLGILSTIHMLNRTGLVTALVSCIFILLANIRFYSAKKIILGIVFFGLIGSAFYPALSESQITTLYTERQKEDEGFSAGGRTKRWLEGLEMLYKKPLGGGLYIDGHKSYAHNFWLDVSALCGVLPLFALLGCTFINYWKSLKIIFSRSINPFFRSWLIALNIGFFLACMVEPIMEGVFTFATLYFFFWGMTSIIYTRVKNMEKLIL